MSQNTTKSDIEKITPAQLQAVELVFAGRNQTQIAEAVGVGRETVSRWINHDSQFQAALNRRRHHLWESFEDRLRGLLPKALEVLEAELETGERRTQAALAILKLAAAQMKPGGLIEAEAIEHEKNRASLLNW
jgi:predicted transcriptional regulator